jgi:hypothetical protein
MPVFVLDTAGPAQVQWTDLPAFERGYIEAAFYTSTGFDNIEEDLGPESGYADLAPEALEGIRRDCQSFLTALARDDDGLTLLDRAYETSKDGYGYDEMCAGRDFWYTRNGHGVGFWDRGLGEIGDALSDQASQFGASDMYRGDDGKIYMDQSVAAPPANSAPSLSF